MKLFILIIIGVLISLVSCNGRKSSVQSDNNTDSIETVSDKQPYMFLETLDIYIDPTLLVVDSLPTSDPLHTNVIGRKQRQVLLDGVIPQNFITDENATTYLISIKAVNDSLVLIQYNVVFSDLSDNYLVLYDSNGKMIDAIFAGHHWDISDLEYNLSDTVELQSQHTTKVWFTSDNSFKVSDTYKEVEHNVNTEVSATTNLQQNIYTFHITPSGFKMDDDIYYIDKGEFRAWTGPELKSKWKLYKHMQSLLLHPYSDSNVLDLWNELGNETYSYSENDITYFEIFLDTFYNYVFKLTPQRVLNWIYKNRDIKSLSLTAPLGFHYRNVPKAKDEIDKAINGIDNSQMREYYKELVELWSK